MNNKFEKHTLYAKNRHVDMYGFRRMSIELTYQDVVVGTVDAVHFKGTWRCSDNTQIANQALEYLWENKRMDVMLKTMGENHGC